MDSNEANEIDAIPAGFAEQPDIALIVSAANAALDKASEALQALCAGRESFTMHIPADVERDHDVIIGDALAVARNLAWHLQVQGERAKKAEAEIEKLHEGFNFVMDMNGGILDRIEKQCVLAGIPTHSDGGENTVVEMVSMLAEKCIALVKED